MAKTTDKKHYEQWQKYRDNISKSTPVDINEDAVAKQKRIDNLERNPEKWFKYYFPNYYTAEPAAFHIKATQRVLTHPEWFEVRSWSRELSKTGRTMMEVLYLCLTGKKKTWLLISNTEDNAERLLAPYKINLETNNRIINDYGEQVNLGKWESTEFTSKKGFSFRALGAGQSPRGTRNEAGRPDGIIIDDFDTDEKCRNKDRVKQDTDWILEAVIPTRSVSGDLLVIVNGNIIAKYCTITILGELADIWEIINLTDKQGNSAWPQKNTKEVIYKMFYNSKGKPKMTKKAKMKEYYNTIITEGETFKNLIIGKCPKISTCEKVVVYADPSPSNNKKSKSSKKCVVVVGFKGLKYYVYKVWLDHATNPEFMEWLYSAYNYLKARQVDPIRMFIENNSLQDPFFQQVIKPLLIKMAREKGYKIPLREDKRKKPDKHDRIEGTLEPKDSEGDLVFNVEEEDNPHMIKLIDQFGSFSKDNNDLDGADAAEGGVWLIDNRVTRADTSYEVGEIPNRKY